MGEHLEAERVSQFSWHCTGDRRNSVQLASPNHVGKGRFGCVGASGPLTSGVSVLQGAAQSCRPLVDGHDRILSGMSRGWNGIG
jgi:hypothetical protein